VPRSGITNVVFQSPGDTVEFTDLERLNLSSMNTLTNEWGVAMMRLQASNLEGTLPGQAITVLLFGNVQIENTGQPTDTVQSFYFRSGVGDAPCVEAPDSGILVQSPQGTGKIALRINEVDIQLGSTAFMQAEPGDDMEINVVEGEAVVTSQGASQIVNAGLHTGVLLDDSGQAASTPEPPAPYDSDKLRVLPVTNLTRSTGIARVILSSAFTQDEEGWTGVNSALTHNAADSTSDGFICSSAENQTPDGYFQSPPAWAGDRSEAYNGNLIFTVRQSAENPAETVEDVFLTGGGLRLTYDMSANPGADWTSDAIPLNETGWMNADGTPATRDQMMTALRALSEVQIHGEAVTCLDSVQLVSIVEPISRGVSTAQNLPTVTPFATASVTSIGFQVSDAITTAGETKTHEFTAQPGQTVYFDAQSDSNDLLWRLTDDTGSTVFNSYLGTDNDPGFHTLAKGGRYTITVSSSDSTATGPYQFQLWDAPLQTFEIAVGDTVSDGQPTVGAGNIETTGVRDIYTFSAQAGQTIYFDAQSDSNNLLWRLTDDTGSTVFNSYLGIQNDPGFYTLEKGGSYTIIVYGNTPDTGTYQFQLWDAPIQNFEITIGEVVSDGQPAVGAGNIESVGVRDIYTFSAQAGQTIYFDAQSDSNNLLWRLTDDTGSTVFNSYLGSQNDPGFYTLEKGGSYTIIVYGNTPDTGTYQFQLWDAPVQNFEIAIGDIVSDGQPQAGAGNIESVGVRDIYTFSAQPGQAVYFDARGDSTDMLWRLTDDTGQTIFNAYLSADNDPGLFTLEKGGSYTIIVYAYTTQTGTYEFQLATQEPR
jgi:hypothetical protein